jgi:DNA-binding SARP family transcriptional activator
MMVVVSVEIHLLDAFAVHLDGTPVADTAWARRDAAALVKVLALAEGRWLHREQVIDRLWPELDLDGAAPRLHKARTTHGGPCVGPTRSSFATTR